MWPPLIWIGKWLVKEAVMTAAMHGAKKVVNDKVLKKKTLEFDSDEITLLRTALQAWKDEGLFNFPDGVPEEKVESLIEKLERSEDAKVAEEDSAEESK